MKICTFTSKSTPSRHLGALSMDGSFIFDLTSDGPRLESFQELISEAEKSSMNLEGLISSRCNLEELKGIPLSESKFLIPFPPQEVWAAGVTYIKSREAREVETQSKGLYSYVYDAERPEVFFKATASRCVGPGDAVAIRSDSKWSVPEPELSLVLSASGRILGYTCGNDMSARDIEGQNPLYLPQAKIFKNCCSLGPLVTTSEELGDPTSLNIRMKIIREGKDAFKGSVSSSQLKRKVEELVSFLLRDNQIPSGTVLMTGTGIVPPDDFSLKNEDIIEIEIDKIGLLKNTVMQL
jgi:2-dehydro-3-deoxy-D-arabinonate dehydratase